MMSMGMPSSKRHMRDDFWSPGFFLPQNQPLFDNRMSLETEDDPWNLTLFPADPLPPQRIHNEGFDGQLLSRSSRKRAYDEDEDEQFPDENTLLQLSMQQREESSVLERYFPDFNPSLPALDSREVAVKVSNPFEEVATRRHHTLKAPMKVKNVNSYVKFRIVPAESNVTPVDEKPLVNTINYSNRPSRAQHSEPSQINASIPGTPVGFGRMFRFDKTDSKLFKFFASAMCAGRTVLPRTNGWLNDLAPMAESNAMMRHAILALSAGYVLDLVPNDDLLERANDHYRKANALLTASLNSDSLFEIGKEDAVVSCIRVMWCDDIVQWELRRSKDQTPRWFLAVQQGKKIMAKTDPGFRYYHHFSNVQCTSARTSNANMMAFVDLVANLTRALSVRESADENLHPWLLEGTDKESRRIYGGTGLCPKLLHMFGQITHLCARMLEDDRSTIIPLGAKAIAQKLTNFHQWSELSDGHASPEILLQSCHLNEKGIVGTEHEVTELSGEAWVQTARIYLQIRFFRLPRNHPHVQQPFKLLCCILKRLPCSGPLFTSQSPFFPVFLAGLVATTPEDRQVARTWFETVVIRASSRSSVPPIWRVLQETWSWMDEGLCEDDVHDANQKPIGERIAWWESLVARWIEREGILSIV